MKVLSIQGSANGSNSATRALSDAYLQQLRQLHPEATVVEHDLEAEAFPHLDSALVAVQLGQGTAESKAQAFSDQLIKELEEADVLLIGAPMYNFGLPSTVKAWFDHVIRVGRTFRYGEQGPEGLLPAGKKAIIFVASGGVYTSGPAAGINFLDPHVKWLLTFIGITDVEFIRAEGLAYGPDAAQKSIAEGKQQAQALAQHA